MTVYECDGITRTYELKIHKQNRNIYSKKKARRKRQNLGFHMDMQTNPKSKISINKLLHHSSMNLLSMTKNHYTYL